MEHWRYSEEDECSEKSSSNDELVDFGRISQAMEVESWLLSSSC